MGSLRQTATAYQPKKTETVDALPSLSIDVDLHEKEGTDNKGDKFRYKVCVVNGQEYRVPESVIADINGLLKLKPLMKTVKVGKSGTGMNTKYSVFPLE